MQKGYTTSLEKKCVWETPMNMYEKFFTKVSQHCSIYGLCSCFWWRSPALKDSLHLPEQNTCFSWKEPWKQALQERGRCTALGEAGGSHAAVTVPTALVRRSAARTACMLKGPRQVCQHTELLLLNSQGVAQQLALLAQSLTKTKKKSSRRSANPKSLFEQCYQDSIFGARCTEDRSQWRDQWWEDLYWHWGIGAPKPC